MSVDEALQEYTHFGNEVFANPRLFHVSSIFWYPRSKFSSQRTQDTFKALICNKLYTGHPDEDDAARQKRMRSATNEPLKSPEGQTQT